jgi:cobalt/nickel transport system permease protein
MSGAHTHGLVVHGHTPIHRMAARVKLVAMLAFVLAVVATPRERMWAFAIHGLLVVTVIAMAELPIRHVLARTAIEIPFVAFAVFLPFLGGGPTVDVGGLALSQEGLWGAWNIIAKGTLGVTASVILVSTTEVPHILRGLGQLKVPSVMVAIAGFMVRYLDVIGGELDRMRTAMAARGHEARTFGQARILATAGGALFIRSYERGERVHQAMLARGFTGTMPDIEPENVTPVAWMTGLSVPLAAWSITAAAVLA